MHRHVVGLLLVLLPLPPPPPLLRSSNVLQPVAWTMWTCGELRKDVDRGSGYETAAEMFKSMNAEPMNRPSGRHSVRLSVGNGIPWIYPSVYSATSSSAR